MTKDFEWRMNLKPFDIIDCQDRSRWYPATVMSRNEELINGMQKVEYSIGFRVYPEHLPDWKNYTKFWPDKTKATDSNNRIFFGDQEGYDEKIPAISKRIHKFGLFTGGAAAKNSTESAESLCIDDFILYEHEQGKTYVVAKSSNFSFYFALLINNFAALGGFESLLNLLKKDADSKEKLNAELLYYIFNFIASASSLFHKEYLKILAGIMKENVIKYLNELSQNDLRNMKKETIELITKVLKYYLSFTLSQEERNEVVENFGLSFSLKMLKTSLLDKRISAVKTIVDLIKSAKNEPDKCAKLLKIIEENKIFYEIYGPNSHIQLINKSKDLLEIMLQEDKLSSGEMEMIWNGTKKGDLEGKLTILKTLKEISQSLKEKHIKMLLENIYLSEPQVLINEEIDLIYDLATHPSQPKNELEKCIKFFLNGLFASKTDDAKKTAILVNKIFQITKLNKKLMVAVLNELIENIEHNKNAYLSFKLLGKFIVDFDKENIYGNNNNNYNNNSDNNSPKMHLPADISQDALCKNIFEENLIEKEKIVKLYIKNFTEYKIQVKAMVENKNWSKDIDLLPFDNFTYSQNIRARLNFLDILIGENVWNIQPDPIDFIFEVLNNNPICEKDSQEFYKWIKKFIEKNLSFEMEEKIFNLFNNKICSDNKKCQNLSIQAFESYLKIFLDINKIKENLDYTYYVRFNYFCFLFY
jgi:ubiquitin carboxyl-terminal hydrolase 34